MAGKIADTCKKVRPLMSTDYAQARLRAIGLYRAFYRFIPHIIMYYDIPKNEQDVRCKIREYFYKNAYVTDVRVIDLLVLKGYKSLDEVVHTWIQKGAIMQHWNPTVEPRPTDFLSKFFSGVD